MIKAVIIDDEPLARSIVKEYLQDYKDITIVNECNDGFEGVKAIMQTQPDLIFLDIQMPKINGFEMLELVEPSPSVIFTTAFDEFAIKAFEAHAIDYLLKPFSKERFDKAIQKWLEQRKNTDSPKISHILSDSTTKQPEDHQRIVVKTGNNIRIIPVNEIQYIEAYDDYVKIYAQDGCFLKKKTMAYYEQTLNESEFVRVHRSFIVQISQITKIELLEKDNHVALLKNGTRIALSKTGYSKLRGVLGL